MKINGNEIRPGNVITHKGGLWAAVKVQHVKPGKGGAFAQVELKNLVDNTKLNERFRSAETVERVRLEQKDYQFLFANGDMLSFMDLESYEQIELPTDFLGDRAAFLQDGMQIIMALHDDLHAVPRTFSATAPPSCRTACRSSWRAMKASPSACSFPIR